MKLKIFIFFSIPFFIISCRSIVFGVKKQKIQESRETTALQIIPKIEKYNINYSLFFRTQKYIDLTKDTLLFSNKIKFYDNSGQLLKLPYTCAPNYYSQVPGFNLETLQIDSLNQIPLKSIISTLETKDYKPATISSHYNKSKYFVVLDWNTFVKRPQNINLKSVIDVLDSDSVFYIFINKDIILEDNLQEYTVSKFSLVSPF